jgi:hypothetical protein
MHFIHLFFLIISVFFINLFIYLFGCLSVFLSDDFLLNNQRMVLPTRPLDRYLKSKKKKRLKRVKTRLCSERSKVVRFKTKLVMIT